jgi:hypothetical protein
MARNNFPELSTVQLGEVTYARDAFSRRTR